MASQNDTGSKLTVPGREVPPGRPRLLQAASRGEAVADPFVSESVVRVERSFELTAPSRAGGAQARVDLGTKLLALEAEDGTTIFVRGDKLREDLARVHPEIVAPDGSIDLAALRDQRGPSRGLADWVWTRLSTLVLGGDGLVEAAREEALSRIGDWLGERAGDLAGGGASWLGAKALMSVIESRLAGEGLYRWSGDALQGSDRVGAQALKTAVAEGPLLIFIHGTGSHTLGAFRDLKTSSVADWNRLVQPFGDRVFGFEHRTFSKSPIENALELARLLPDGARVSLVTHSRGGLVGDLLCLGGLSAESIAQYRHALPPVENESEAARARRQALIDKVAAEEQAQLRELVQLLNRDLSIERYVRVACPANGTALLSDNLEVFLSGVLSLMGAAVGAVTGPGGSAVFSAFKRIVLEIADKRIDPHLVPGIEAMLVDAPMGPLLARSARRQGVKMAVIAGDIEGGNVLKRIAVLFTDWMFFDNFDNDLVVDTASMYGGLADREDTHALFDAGADVNHFAYFGNPLTRTALRDWLTSEAPEALPVFKPVELVREPSPAEVAARSAARAPAAPGTQPAVIVLPGTMGSHLKRESSAGHVDRVWFDFLDLALGGLGKIRYGEPNIGPDGLFEMFYGDLCEFLERTHEVVRFAYDWRKPLHETGLDLAAVVARKLEETKAAGHPVRLIAHSMGGLVVRAFIAQRADLWDAVCARPGGRLVMLGTPNNGSHLMVETLIGKSDTIRKLARLDVPRAMQGVLDIVAGFPGALQLLPRPGFPDAGTTPYPDYYVHGAWTDLKQRNRDRWFGDRIVGVPQAKVLEEARRHWDDAAFTRPITHPERIAYVYGQDERTPCGVKLKDDGVKLIGTPRGDGSVTWAMGKLDGLPDERYWYMPATHGDLADVEEHFPALLELLQAGATDKLGRLPELRGAAETFEYEAAPTAYPTDAELARSVLKSRPKRREPPRKAQTLDISVRAMDLRAAQLPLLCGHYIGDPIAGAEARIDELVHGGLRQRHQLGLYPGAVGTHAVVLKTPSAEETRRGTRKGALVVGLGEYGRLSAAELAETVRAGVLAYLADVYDREALPQAEGVAAAPQALSLLALIIGYNSTTNISIEASIEAIARGVCEANRQYADRVGPQPTVARLQFVELYLDTAISAARAVRTLAQRMERDLRRLNVRLRPAPELQRGEGVRQRLQAGGGSGYWPRLSIVDADRTDDVQCAPECYELRIVSPIPQDVRQRLRRAEGGEAATPAGAPAASEAVSADVPVRAPVPDRLRFTFLGERARAEAVVQQRQPGLIEALIKDAIRHDSFNADIARTLFQLMVPLDFKGTTRQTDRLILVLDRYTANLPWEMLQADEEPLVVRMRVVRQLVSRRFRASPRGALIRSACVISSPSTQGFYDQFAGLRPSAEPLTAEKNRLPPLPGAEQEAERIREILGEQRYQVRFSPPDTGALDVLNRLFEAPYRILVIAAHGEFDVLARDGKRRTGVVLSDGLMLTAVEVGQMEVVPDLVFLNCCHLGAIDAASGRNRLAASLSAELIEMGVRCVVAAGWKVNDQAANLFAEVFFKAMLERNLPFGDAVWEARKETYGKFPTLNTWGAYQAYGDPSFVLDPNREEVAPSSVFQPVAVEELLERLRGLQADAGYRARATIKQLDKQLDRLLGAAPQAWKDLPQVQAVLGDLFADYLPEGFERARGAYLRAIAEEDKAGAVPVRAIERLANLEARAGEAMGDESGAALVDTAIARLRRLLQLSGDILPAVSAGLELAQLPRNAERFALLASAHKRKAALLVRRKRGWADIEAELICARDAYARAEGEGPERERSPYAGLNRLQLDGLVGDFADSAQVEDRVALSRRYADVARQLFGETLDFFDAIMPADALLAEVLLRNQLARAREQVLRAYLDAGQAVPRTSRQFDSVVKQLRLLADFVRARKRAGDAQAAEVLTAIAAGLNGDAQAVVSDGVPDQPAAAPGAGPRAATPKAAAKKKKVKRPG
jgi:CHAT domain-containing protein